LKRSGRAEKYLSPLRGRFVGVMYNDPPLQVFHGAQAAFRIAPDAAIKPALPQKLFFARVNQVDGTAATTHRFVVAL
jgi:hypothetical protein